MKGLICLVKLSDLQCMITKYVRLCNCMQSLHLICLYACIRKKYFKYIGSTSGLGFGSPRSKASLIFTVYSDINRHSRLNMFKAFPYSKVKYVQGFQGRFWATLMLSCVYIIHKIIWSWILYYTVHYCTVQIWALDSDGPDTQCLPSNNSAGYSHHGFLLYLRWYSGRAYNIAIWMMLFFH